MSDPWTLEYAIDIARIGSNRGPYRAHYGGLWHGENNGPCDASFADWGLAKATEVILNAAVTGKLVIK